MSSRSITKWEDCLREDLNHIPKMIAAGFYPEFSYRDMMHGRTDINNPPHDAVSFRKAGKCVWKAISFSTQEPVFKVADLIGGHYCNHRTYKSLQEVIDAGE